MSILSETEAFGIIARDIMRFVDERPWEIAVGKYGILQSMVSSEWWIESRGHRISSGGRDSSMEESKEKSRAIRFLREKLLRDSGARIWGLTFTLYPDGKFHVDYDYNKPEGYEDADEALDLTEAIESLNRLGVQVEVNDSKKSQ